jgi:hypothetical protein
VGPSTWTETVREFGEDGGGSLDQTLVFGHPFYLGPRTWVGVGLPIEPSRGSLELFFGTVLHDVDAFP